MDRLTLVRYLVLLVPLAGLALAWRLRPDRAATSREAAAAGLALTTALVGISALDALAQPAGWWSYPSVTGRLRGMPVDLWLGWALLWGPVPVLLRHWLPVPYALALLAWIDLVALPELHPLLRLGPAWLLGETIGLAAVALPALLLGRWTAQRRRLTARTTLQLATFAGLLLWLLPAVAIDLGDGSWRRLAALESWQAALLLQTVAAVAVPGVAAVRELVGVGGGTPFPWDPPTRLVVTGPYAYLANPMQLSGVALLLVAAFAVGSWSLAAGAVLAVAFSAVVAGPHEQAAMLARWGSRYLAYAAAVRPWWPRRYPYLTGEARIWLGTGVNPCQPCLVVARRLHRLRPAGLRIEPAWSHPRTLWRARYEGPPGTEADGVAALARALEHTRLDLAYLGWVARTPVLDRLVQLFADGLGAGPRPAPGRPGDSELAGGERWPTPGSG